MENMPFPDEYKEPLLDGRKNTTIRIGRERKRL